VRKKALKVSGFPAHLGRGLALETLITANPLWKTSGRRPTWWPPPMREGSADAAEERHGQGALGRAPFTKASPRGGATQKKSRSHRNNNAAQWRKTWSNRTLRPPKGPRFPGVRDPAERTVETADGRPPCCWLRVGDLPMR